MNTPIDPTGSHYDPLDAVIADYLQQVEAGAVPDRAALLGGHPEFADRLRDFFADYDRLDRQAAELRLSGEPKRPAGRAATCAPKLSSWPKSPAPSTTPTSAAFCTVTSSRPTYSCRSPS